MMPSEFHGILRPQEFETDTCIWDLAWNLCSLPLQMLHDMLQSSTLCFYVGPVSTKSLAVSIEEEIDQSCTQPAFEVQSPGKEVHRLIWSEKGVPTLLLSCESNL